MRDEFIYLAVVLDAYSRKVVGWNLGRNLEAQLALGALRMALRQPDWKAEGLIHHPDRGVQYASTEYTGLLEQNDIQISMSRRGNPYDNPRAERFMRTLKEEEVNGADYRNLEDAGTRTGEFIEQVYNRKRLHSALGYLTPEEFEQISQARGSAGAGEAVENQRTVYHRFHRPWKSLPDSHTPAARRLLIHQRHNNRPRCHPLNRLLAYLNDGVQFSSVSEIDFSLFRISNLQNLLF